MQVIKARAVAQSRIRELEDNISNLQTKHSKDVWLVFLHLDLYVIYLIAGVNAFSKRELKDKPRLDAERKCQFIEEEWGDAVAFIIITTWFKSLWLHLNWNLWEMSLKIEEINFLINIETPGFDYALYIIYMYT